MKVLSILIQHPNLTYYQKYEFSKKDRYSYYLSYCTLVSSVPLLETQEFQLQWRDVFYGFMEKIQDACFEITKLCNIGQKYLSTVTEMSPTEIPSTQGWHMKDNWHTYLFQKSNIIDNKSNFGARLDQIILSCFVMNM